ncbi:MAG: hypothetical protein CBB60_009940 [Armatimonadetes bacterium Cent15-Ar3]|nr:MAG: hypothetical protein CBB60_009940 [Armatimonadetes bacterium Cent15-Ar3]
MKRTLSFILAGFVVVAMAADAAKISDLVKKPESFDKKTVKVTGTVDKFKAKTSKAGNDYYVFDLKEGKEKISVYGRGKLDKEPKDGDKVEIEGKFEKEHKINDDFSVKNQVTVGGKKGEAPKLKILSK